MYSVIRQIVCMVAAEIKAMLGGTGGGFSNFLMGPAGGFIYQVSGNFHPLAIGVPSYIKIASGLLDSNNIIDKDSMIVEGTLKEILDIMIKLYELPFNLFDYLEPITEEEFYNIKPE